jgi:hypothetical protein
MMVKMVGHTGFWLVNLVEVGNFKNLDIHGGIG